MRVSFRERARGVPLPLVAGRAGWRGMGPSFENPPNEIMKSLAQKCFSLGEASIERPFDFIGSERRNAVCLAEDRQFVAGVDAELRRSGFD